MANEGDVKRENASIPFVKVSLPHWLASSMDVNEFLNFPFR